MLTFAPLDFAMYFARKLLSWPLSFWIFFLIIIFSFLVIGCTSKPPASSVTQQSKTAAASIDPATAASVGGTVTFSGQAPKPAPIDMSYDPDCKGKALSESLVVNHGALANVFVYVKSGLGDRTFSVPQTPAVIDQSGCQYRPHVLGVMAGQSIEFKNDDSTTHNVHVMPKANTEWNRSEMPGAQPFQTTFTNPEIMMPVHCNQHPWMNMYVNVVNSPFFAITDAAGNFQIKGLPPGKYTLAFVQEKLGEQDREIVLQPKEIKNLDLSFQP